MQKERPIIFNTEMVKAILEGRKTQTRRMVKMPDLGYMAASFLMAGDQGWSDSIKYPYGSIGDLLYVRETWAGDGLRGFVYRADNPTAHISEFSDGEVQFTKWEQSIYMPKKAARIWLKVTNVSVERVQDISDKNAGSEGIVAFEEGIYNYKNYLYKDDGFRKDWGVNTAKKSFESLWKSIYGIESWDQNPWVWAIEFEVVNQNH